MNESDSKSKWEKLVVEKLNRSQNTKELDKCVEFYS